MQSGSRVTLVGLQSRADLNQCGATLLAWDSAVGRWGVQVEGSGEMMRIKPANMEFGDLDLAQEVGAAIWDAAKDGKHARLSALLKSVPPGSWGDVVDEAARGGGSSALSAAAGCDHPECVALLLELSMPSPNVNLGNRFGASAVHRAAEGGSAKALQMLLAARGCPHTPDSQGQSPLCYAAEEGRTECARVLLQAGASPSAKYRGATPYQWALNGGHASCAALLAGKADGSSDAPLAYNPKHDVPAADFNPMLMVDAARSLEDIEQTQKKAQKKRAKKNAKKTPPPSSDAPLASADAPPDISDGLPEEPLPPSDPPRAVLKALASVTRISADHGGLSTEQRRRLRTAPDIVLHLLKYVDGAASLTPTCERVLMGGLGVTLGDSNGASGGCMMAVACFPWAHRAMQGWSSADWAWFLALSCHKFSDVLPPVCTAHHYSILPSFKYAPADPWAWAARLERSFRVVAALPRFSCDPQSLLHKFGDHADLTACLEFAPMNFDLNGDASYTFDTKWPWRRAAELLGVRITDQTATPALEYKFGEARKVLASDGRWFDSAQDYILHRCSENAGERGRLGADVESVARMMCSISSADQEATCRGQSGHEMMSAYCKRTKHLPMSKALKQAYEKHGLLLPEAEVLGVIKSCAMCHTPQPPAERFQCCPCGLVYYCSKECQRADWKSHKQAHKQATDDSTTQGTAAGLAAAVDAEMSAAHPGSNAGAVYAGLRGEEQVGADGAELARRSALQSMERLLDSLPPGMAQQIRSGGGNRGSLSREELQRMMPPGYSL